MPEFQAALKRGGFYPEDYGFILEHGKGEADELLKEKMWMQYRCDHKNAFVLMQANANQQPQQKQKVTQQEPPSAR